MARTQINRKDIKNADLTGASFRPELGFFDETRDYTAGEQAIWAGNVWELLQDITATAEGDLSNAPSETNTKWKKVTPIGYNVYPSASQTFNDTAVTLEINTEREAEEFNRLYLDTNDYSVVFNSGGDFIVHFEFSAANTTTTRAITKAWLENSTDGGSTWNEVPNSLVWTYNRTSGAGISTGSLDLPLYFNGGDKLRIRMQCTSAINIETDPTACNLTIFSNKSVSGPKGDKGDKGDTGAPGDIIWTGPYDSARTYQINEAVEYLGSSYVSIANDNTETPSETATNWDLIAQKGDAGAGSQISVADDGNNIPNTPHDTLNFVGEYIQATDAGNGVADIEVLPTKQSYMVPIWAEENAALNDNTYEWAFGNGANTPQNNGIAVFIPDGYKAEVVALSLTLRAGDATVELEVSGILTGNRITTDTAVSKSSTLTLTTPYALSNGDRINFKTYSQNNTSNPNTITAWIKYTEL